MAISLEKELKEAKASKKRYRSLFIVATLLLLFVLSLIYKLTVLDYAVLESVTIEKSYNGITFNFDVVEEGKLEFHHGEAVLIDNFDVESGRTFSWSWTATGETEISIRSRNYMVLPYWNSETFEF
jgi:hypothetical protein